MCVCVGGGGVFGICVLAFFNKEWNQLSPDPLFYTLAGMGTQTYCLSSASFDAIALSNRNFFIAEADTPLMT